MPSEVIQRRHGRYTLSTDPALVDVEAVHRFLSESSYWARGQPFDVQARFGYAPMAEPAQWMVRKPSNSPPADRDADG